MRPSPVSVRARPCGFLIAALLTLGIFGGTGYAAPTASADPVPAKIKTAKHSLLEGIQQAQKDNGIAISAKFEVEDGKLQLSVYTAKAGLDKDAEHNTLIELSGEAAKPKWEPKTEVFSDREHLARSATQLTLLETSSLTLEEAAKKATAQKKGTVYSVIPAAKDGKTVFDVLVATPNGKTIHLAIDDTTK
jgi:uncharacterized membrane protein YkoI